MEAQQAYSSSSSGSSYEVFLSFRGADVRTNFADHLYNALDRAGIRTFRDEDELRKGSKIGPELLAAIQQSRIYIPIFSEDYASSKWCLHELTEISEYRRTMNRIVLPVFFKVEPAHVRYQTGRYAKAFEKHQMRFDETTVQKWKKALREVGELSGWHSKEGTYEGKIITEVVETVWRTLNKRPLNVSNNLIGIQSHIKEMLILLDIESNENKIVGIHGIGGIGKTTIARAVYSIVFHHYEGYSFIENIQENAQKHGIPHLQNQLIFDILKQENVNITNVDDGVNVIQQRFFQKKVIIVLDDVDQDIQAKYLVGDREWFGVGSKIIITSRNKDIMHAVRADVLYEPDVMNLADSLELFRHHAFGSDQPTEDYLELSRAMVKTTGGLPLALEFIGSSLYRKGKSVWEDMLKMLPKVPNNYVMKRLKISYDELEYENQQMFLDTACFFIGMNKDIVCHIWDGCGFSPQVGLDALCARSLVTIGEDGELRMHDQLRDLGRDIVRQESRDEPKKRTRIWCYEEVLDVLDTRMGTSRTSDVKGLSIICRNKGQCLMSEGFAAMTKLRLLKVDYAIFSGNLFTHSFSELRWLSWRGCPNDQYAQTNFCPRKLVVLDLSHSEITENWMGWNCIKMAVNLKVLRLASCLGLSRTPDLSANRLLEELILNCCHNLVEIGTSIGFLSNLGILDMGCCERLVCLPTEICQLTSLKRLDLEGCNGLDKLPERLSSMTSLTALDLCGCCKLKLLPSLPQHLEVLILSYCANLVEINASIGYLRNLLILEMRYCKSLVDLPLDINQLSCLQRLDLEGCNGLRKLPEKLGCIITLTTLDLSGFCNLESLPMLSSLKNMKELHLRACKKLLHISNLPLSLTSLDVCLCSSIRYISGLPSSLTSLDASGCKSLKKLSCTSGLRNLETLKLDKCHELEEIEGIDEGLDSLVHFSISRCQLKELPRLTGLKKLRKLKISTKNSGVDRLEFIEKLDVSGCESLESLPDLSNNLKELLAHGCKKLTVIHGVTWKLLEKLDVSGCESLESLPDMSNNLKELLAHGCKKLTVIHGVTWKLLEKLDVSGCESLESLPDMSNNLKELLAHGCKKLTVIHGVTWKLLEKLDVSGCESLESLPDMSNNLKELLAHGCKKLTVIHGVTWKLLEKLDVSGCESLESLPDMSNNLKELLAHGCKNLTVIHGVTWKLLEKLDISGCESLERFPDLSNNLKELRANG